jgi:hypothetical protein
MSALPVLVRYRDAAASTSARRASSAASVVVGTRAVEDPPACAEPPSPCLLVTGIPLGVEIGPLLDQQCALPVGQI